MSSAAARTRGGNEHSEYLCTDIVSSFNLRRSTSVGRDLNDHGGALPFPVSHLPAAWSLVAVIVTCLYLADRTLVECIEHLTRTRARAPLSLGF